MPSFVNRCLSLKMHRLMHFFLVLYCLLCILPPSSKRNFQEASKMQNIKFCKFSITPHFLSPQIIHPFLSNFESLSFSLFCSSSMNSVLGKSLYEIMNLVSTLFDHSSSTHDSPYIPEINPPESTSTGPVMIINAANLSKLPYYLPHKLLTQLYNSPSPSNPMILTTTYDVSTASITSKKPLKPISSVKNLEITNDVNSGKKLFCDISPIISPLTLPPNYKLHHQHPSPSAHVSLLSHRRIKPLSSLLRKLKLPSITTLKNIYMSSLPRFSQISAKKTSKHGWLHPIITPKPFFMLPVHRILTTHIEVHIPTYHISKELSLSSTFYQNFLLCILCLSPICYIIFIFFIVVFMLLFGKLIYVNNFLSLLLNHSQYSTPCKSNSMRPPLNTLNLLNARERTLPTVHGGALLPDIHISKQLLNPSTHSKDIDHRKNPLRDTRPSSSTSLPSTTISTYPFPSTLHPFPAIKTSRIVFLYPIITFKAFSFPSVLRISINPVEDYRCYFSTTHPSMFKEPSCFLTFHFNILLCILCFSLICSVIYTFFYVVSIITSLYLSQITNNHRQIGHSLDAPVSTPSQRSDQPLLTHNTNQESSHSLSTPRPDLSTARRQDFNVYHEAEDPGPK